MFGKRFFCALGWPQPPHWHVVAANAKVLSHAHCCCDHTSLPWPGLGLCQAVDMPGHVLGEEAATVQVTSGCADSCGPNSVSHRAGRLQDRPAQSAGSLEALSRPALLHLSLSRTCSSGPAVPGSRPGFRSPRASSSLHQALLFLATA